jgi:TolA-binding protein
LAASLSSPRRRIAAVAGGMALGGGVLLALAMPRQRPPIASTAELGLLPVTRTQSAIPPIEPLKPSGMPRASGGSSAAAPAPAAATSPSASPSSRDESASRPATVAPASIESRPLVPAEREVAPGRPTEDLRIAREKIALKLYDPALDTLRRIVAQTTNRDDAIEAFFLIASVHETRGEMDHAMSTYLEVSRRFPDTLRAAEALLDLAQATLKSKRRDKEVDARRVLSEVVQKYPASAAAPRALLLRGELEERQGLYQRDEELGGSIPSAVLSYRAVVERYGSSAASTIALAKLGRIYADTKRFESATVVLEQLAERDRDNAYDAWFTAGEIYDKRLKDPKRARAAYERVPASSPHYADAQKRLRK